MKKPEAENLISSHQISSHISSYANTVYSMCALLRNWKWIIVHRASHPPPTHTDSVPAFNRPVAYRPGTGTPSGAGGVDGGGGGGAVERGEGGE
jgi:hypothetical protein